MFRLALVQMKVIGGDLAGNVARAVSRCSEVADLGANIALLPECMDLGWTHSRRTM